MKYIVLFLIFFTLNADAKYLKSNSHYLKKFHNFLRKIHFFEADFIQESNNNNDISAGRLLINNDTKQMRIDYFNPNRVSLIITEKKIIYYNHELNAAQYLYDKENFYLYLLNKKITSYVKKIEYDEEYVTFIIKVSNDLSVLFVFTQNPFMLKKLQQKNDHEIVIIDFGNVSLNANIPEIFLNLSKLNLHIANY